MLKLKHPQIFGFSSLVFFLIALGLFLFFGRLFQTAIIIHLVLFFSSVLAFIYFGGAQNIFKRIRGQNKLSYSSFPRIVYSLMLLVCFLLVLYLVQVKLPMQHDTTEEGVYTLSEQSRQLLTKLKKPVRARYFVRGLNSSKSDIDLLRRYSFYTKDFYVSQHDLDKERPLAASLGITDLNSVHLSFEGESGQGVLVSGGVNEEKITNALLKLTRPIKPSVHFIEGHGELSVLNEEESGFSLLKEALEADGFVVSTSTLEKVSKFPKENTLIAFLNPKKDFLPLELEELRKYYQQGGNFVIFTEPLVEINLIEFLREIGFKIGKDTIVGIEKFTSGSASLGVQPIISNYTEHASLKNFDKSIIISAARSVAKLASADLITEIAYSDAETWAETNLEDLYSKTPKALKDSEDIYGPVPFTAVLERRNNTQENEIQRGVVLGDLDFVANVNLHQLFNRDYVLNLFNWAAGDEENISIRVGSLRRSKKVISEEEYSNIFLWVGLVLPECILLLGFYFWQKGRWR